MKGGENDADRKAREDYRGARASEEACTSEDAGAGQGARMSTGVCGVCGRSLAQSRALICHACMRAGVMRAVVADLPEPELEMVAEPITGYRCWDITYSSRDNTPRLQSIGSHHNWASPIEEADCRSTLPHRGDDSVCPGFNCTCGMWAYGDRQQTRLAQLITERAGLRAWGSVKMWGRIIQHEYGYRAQYAKPDRIHVVHMDEKTANQLADYYDCVVIRHDGVPGVFYSRAGFYTETGTSAGTTVPIPKQPSWFNSKNASATQLALCFFAGINSIASLALPGTQWGNVILTWILFYAWLSISSWKTIRKIFWAPPFALSTVVLSFYEAARFLISPLKVRPFEYRRRLWAWWRRGGE